MEINGQMLAECDACSWVQPVQPPPPPSQGPPQMIPGAGVVAAVAPAETTSAARSPRMRTALRTCMLPSLSFQPTVETKDARVCAGSVPIA
jgi:hypothetical protein